jgi:hypothetical protein
MDTIIVDVPIVQVAPAWNRVNLDSLTVVDSRKDGKMTIQARIRLYYEDANGVREYAKEHQDVYITDADSWAAVLFAAGNQKGTKALTEIAKLTSLLVKEFTNWGNTTVV